MMLFSFVWCSLMWFCGLVWFEVVCCDLVWFGVVGFGFSLVWCTEVRCCLLVSALQVKFMNKMFGFTSVTSLPKIILFGLMGSN
jgi:hypothetical protein